MVQKSVGCRPAWRQIDRNVPIFRCARPMGTMTVLPPGRGWRYLAWEPRWWTSSKPCRRSVLMTSSEEGPSGTLENQLLDVGVRDGLIVGGGLRLVEVQFERLQDVRAGLGLG